jgi:hypothetical protein
MGFNKVEVDCTYARKAYSGSGGIASSILTSVLHGMCGHPSVPVKQDGCVRKLVCRLWKREGSIVCRCLDSKPDSPFAKSVT